MHLDWSALGEVALVSVAATVGIVFVFALGVRALAMGEETTGPENGGRAGPLSVAVAVAGLCFLACAVVVLYGLYLIVPQFH
ncbi:hypothetical protein [Streptomyces sp. NPDC088725]|uniref:hypothetical protein n=1 Tax=Streptomyces sp. NPDC088725 TaxID=3365873 RepID=UPI0038299387